MWKTLLLIIWHMHTSFFKENFYFLYKSGKCVFSKRNFWEREGFAVYIMYTPCVFFKAFSLEMDIQWGKLWVHFALLIHKTDTATWLHQKITSFSAWNTLSSQFPWHQLTKCGTIERKTSSYNIFSGALGSWKVMISCSSFAFCPVAPTHFQNLAFWLASCHSFFYHLISVYQTGHLKSTYISETVQHASFELRDPLSVIWQNLTQTFCNSHPVYADRICKLPHLFILLSFHEWLERFYNILHCSFSKRLFFLF